LASRNEACGRDKRASSELRLAEKATPSLVRLGVGRFGLAD
jgi:hypothetical protein